jgi:monomeric isocitrate dehydrogenase
MRNKPPTILLTKSSPDRPRTTEILSAEAVYAVFYDGSPINERHTHPRHTTRYDCPVYVNSESAISVAKRLNREFTTDLFTVHHMISGDVVPLLPIGVQ